MSYLRLPKPLPAEVCRAYLQDKREGWDDWLPFDIVGIESYEGEVATVVVKSPDGGVFFDIPFSALRVPGSPISYKDPGDFVYCPSPRGDIAFKELGLGDAVQVFDRTRQFVGRGTYHVSITWVDDNVLLNLVSLNGRFMLWPPHKLKWSDGPVSDLPDWQKRRYASDLCAGQVTPNTRVEWDDFPEDWFEIAKSALSSLEGWRVHGLGMAQKYVDEDTRVHVWHADLGLIGIEGGIHNHRWGLVSHVVYGSLFQEEWLPTPDPNGFWVRWEHGNEGNRQTHNTNERYSLQPMTARIDAGQVYTFPKGPYHRSVLEGELTVTVLRRTDRSGQSSAMIPVGVTPRNGLDVTPGEEVFARVMARARHLLGVPHE